VKDENALKVIEDIMIENELNILDIQNYFAKERTIDCSLFNKLRISLDNIEKKALQKYLKEKFKELFIKYPEIETASWTQYTPFFADGDICIFGLTIMIV
jgi:hypothetical protein